MLQALSPPKKLQVLCIKFSFETIPKEKTEPFCILILSYSIEYEDTQACYL
jgi:hypothetical protein